MATYSSHRLKMGKVDICNFFFLNGDIWNFFTEMFIGSSSMFHITFVQIGVLDWLSGRQKGSIFVKMFKNLLLRNHKEDGTETWHTCLGHYPLQKLCFFYFGRIRTLVAMATQSFHRLIMGKVEIDNFCQVIWDI